MRKLKLEIAKIQQEMKELVDVMHRIERGDTAASVKAEYEVLAKVAERLTAALPASSDAPKAERKKRAPRGLPKPNGKAATA